MSNPARHQSLWPLSLTFDVEHPDRSGWAEETLDVVLSVLTRRRVPATFFLQGRWVEARPDAARRIAARGHALGNHSYFHADMRLMTVRGISEDVVKAERVIRDTTGISPKPYFRCPFGLGARSQRVLRTIHDLGYDDVGWDVSANDWQPTQTPERICRDIVSAARPGSVVIMHSWPRAVGAALENVVDSLRARGAAFVPLSVLWSTPQR